MTPIKIRQGYDHVINITHDYLDLPSATAISVYIGTSPKIVKTLTDGVSDVTSSVFVLTIAGGDTANVPSAEYPIEARITAADGSNIYGRIQPSTLRVIDSVFSDTD